MDSALAGPVAAILASVTWATGVLAYSKLSTTYPAYIVNLYRIFIGLPAACLILIMLGGWGASIDAMTMTKFGWAIVVVLSSYALGDAVFFMSTKRLGGPAALAISSVYPLWSALWGAFFENQKLTALQIFGVLTIIGGVIAVILSGAKKEDVAPGVPRLQELKPKFYRKILKGTDFWGLVLAILASLFWSMNTVAVSKLGEGMNVMFVNVLRLGIAIVLCPLIGIGMNGKSSFKLIPIKTLVPYLPVFAVESILGPFFYVYGLSHSSLAVGAALTALAPAISVPVAVVLGREKFSPLKSAGIIAVLAGTFALLGLF